MNEEVYMKVMKRTLRDTVVDFIPINLFDEQNWCSFIILNLNQPSITVTATSLRDFVVLMGSSIIEAMMEYWLEPCP